MGIRSFALGVILLAAVGWCMVQESIMQTKARYRLAELARRETELRNNLDRLAAVEEGLRRPSRLAELMREKRLDMVALRRNIPDKTPSGFKPFANRLPGEVKDETYLAVIEALGELDVDVAIASDW